MPSDIAACARGRIAVFNLPGVGNAKPITTTVVVTSEVKLSLRTKEPSEAKFRHVSASTQALAFFEGLRAGPAPLSHRQIIALSGEAYRLYTERFLENPGSPEAWEAMKAFNRAAQEGRVSVAPALSPSGGCAPVARMAAVEVFGSDLTAGINALPKSSDVRGLHERFGLLAEWVLAKHQITADEQSRLALLRAIADATTDAGWALKRAARGDYTPDLKALRFPPISAAKPPLMLGDLIEQWKKEAQPSASTLSTWTGVFADLKRALGRAAEDIASIEPDHLLAWKAALLDRGLSPKTVNDSYLAAARTVFSYGVVNRLCLTNPVIGIRANTRRRAGTGRLPYTDDEVAQILSLARQEVSPQRRWLLPLAAATGARIGELAQLWGSRVVTENGRAVLKIAPAEDGGSLKNEGSERTVPLHRDLIREGFLDFVQQRGAGPLFYSRTSGRPTARHASKGVANHLASWVRLQSGFQDRRKAPAHALRHWFKSAAVRAGISDSIADAIQGHAPRSVAGHYRHFDLNTLAEAVDKLPLPAVLSEGTA